MKKKSLGKGLDALFEDNSTTLSSGTERVRMADIVPNKEQPRRDFDLAALEQLAASIREHGVIQPLVLRPDAKRHLPDCGGGTALPRIPHGGIVGSARRRAGADRSGSDGTGAH